jgi:hypothetical protein
VQHSTLHLDLAANPAGRLPLSNNNLLPIYLFSSIYILGDDELPFRLRHWQRRLKPAAPIVDESSGPTGYVNMKFLLRGLCSCQLSGV